MSMDGQPNRLPGGGAQRFGGREIDRGRPLRFWLDGRLIRGFAGDSVLSAALGSGIVAAGRRGGERLALDERLAPAVVVRRRGQRAGEALPMARMPAVDGLQ